ncbi:hypothetical protein P7C70_g4954, partial [Phenoliferia sp. Uapishka_3]
MSGPTPFRLEYNLTRPYPWRSYTWVTITFFIIAFVGLSALNNFQDPNATLLFNFLAQPNCTGSQCTDAEYEQPTEVVKNPDYAWNRVGAGNALSQLRGSFEADTVCMSHRGFQTSRSFNFQDWGFGSNVSARNMFQGLLAAVRLDLGNLHPNNFFTSPTSLNATIIASANPGTSNLRVFGTGYNLLAQLPLNSTSLSSPTLISSEYLCTRAKLKSPASLISSVFASTLTMVLAIWGAWSLAATWLARKHYERRTHHGTREADREAARYDNTSMPLRSPRVRSFDLDRESSDFKW